MSLYDETATTAQQLVDDGVWQTLFFGPGVVDGDVVDDPLGRGQERGASHILYVAA